MARPMRERAKRQEAGEGFPTNRMTECQAGRRAGFRRARAWSAILVLGFAGQIGFAPLGTPPVSGATWAADEAGAGIGEPAPDFFLPSATGGEVSLAAFRGKKGVVLVFYMGQR